jgi:acetyl/propionyl-CoA carboxylase alpha subunit
MIYNLPPYPQALSSSPAQPCSWQGSNSNLHGWAEGKNQNAPKTDNNSPDSKTNTAHSQNSPAEESYLETELENFDQLMEGMPLKQFTWQTSDQLPDPALKTAIYKEELRRQIIQKKKDEEEKAQRERDEEEKLERKIQEYDERMRREVKQEQNRSYVKTNMQTSQHREQVRMNAEQFGGVSERERLEAQIQEKNKLSQKQQRGSREKHSNKSFEHQVEAGGDASETPDRSPRTASPPVPSVKKRLETQSESSLRSLESKSGRNMHALSDILNSLGLEKQRMERVIKRKLNLH